MIIWQKMDNAPKDREIIGLDKYRDQAIIIFKGPHWGVTEDGGIFYPVFWTECPEVPAEIIAEIERATAERMQGHSARMRDIEPLMSDNLHRARIAELRAERLERESKLAIRERETGRLAWPRPFGSSQEPD